MNTTKIRSRIDGLYLDARWPEEFKKGYAYAIKEALAVVDDYMPKENIPCSGSTCPHLCDLGCLGECPKGESVV